METGSEEPCFYVVASPIGQTSDFSERAKRILESVDLVFCEDTRVAGLLLSKLNLKKKLFSCDSHREKKASENLLIYLNTKKKVAYLSDAGTPGISDPGNFLVKTAREHSFKVIPVPGASALSTVLSICSFDLSKGFFFFGFLPKSKTKIQRIFQNNLVENQNILVLFESPYRVKKTLEILKEIAPESEICLARELTKKYEQIVYFFAKDLEFQDFKEKGEFSLVINPNFR